MHHDNDLHSLPPPAAIVPACEAKYGVSKCSAHTHVDREINALFAISVWNRVQWLSSVVYIMCVALVCFALIKLTLLNACSRIFRTHCVRDFWYQMHTFLQHK